MAQENKREDIKKIVNKLYGTQGRSAKNDSRETLIDKVLDELVINKHIVQIGLFRKLPVELRNVVGKRKKSDSKLPSINDLKIQKAVAQFLLEHEGESEGEYICVLTKTGKTVLQSIINDEEYPCVNKIFNIKQIFYQQERDVCQLK